MHKELQQHDDDVHAWTDEDPEHPPRNNPSFMILASAAVPAEVPMEIKPAIPAEVRARCKPVAGMVTSCAICLRALGRSQCAINAEKRRGEADVLATTKSHIRHYVHRGG